MNEHAPTIAQALDWAAGYLHASSPTARLDAELLLAHVLAWPRARLLAEGRMRLEQRQDSIFRDLVARRAALEPIAYLVGHKEFYGLDFFVDPRVLVPRPETELLVELALRFARQRTNDERPNEIESAALVLGPASLLLADVGTGSGAIAVALAVHLPMARLIAIDISPAALELARQNVERHGVAERVRLLQGDLLDPLGDPVDLIVSNPPYTILEEIDEGVRRYEPRLALDGGADGLELYRRLLALAPAKLRPGGAVLLEIGATQAAAVTELAREAFPKASVSIHQDLAGRDRVVIIDDRVKE
ncbi:MAG TPA: peptide chain release factor N(5)-glutamine methyltransferase [Roseiflexaceae bacterium]|nr:peptide chain release factor N(5)-glutamine methyltransferase [Roseiflexaceae bacterium]